MMSLKNGLMDIVDIYIELNAKRPEDTRVDGPWGTRITIMSIYSKSLASESLSVHWDVLLRMGILSILDPRSVIRQGKSNRVNHVQIACVRAGWRFLIAEVIVVTQLHTSGDTPSSPYFSRYNYLLFLKIDTQ